MRLHWDAAAEKLHVRETFLQQTDSIVVLSDCLLSLWRFPSYCGSRWCTQGSACRCLVQGLLTGFDSLVRHMRQSGKLSDYDANG
eukprot:6215304-Amphidinium_carterae.1